MNYKTFFLYFFLILSACTNVQYEKKDLKIIHENIFTAKGFALVYSDNLINNKIIKNKIDNRSLIIFQKNLKKNTNVKITNLINGKYIIATVGKKTLYPNFYNSVLSQRISKELEIDLDEPYVEIKEINNNSLFVAKKAKTFDEEKNVATKAPVDEIEIKSLSGSSAKKTPKDKKNFNYIIKIADFYFEKSAKEMAQIIKSETSIKKVKINKISTTKFRVFLGPFNNLNYLKKQFNAINTLQFENIEIIKK